MIEIKKKYIIEKYFSRKLLLKDFLLPVLYIQSYEKKSRRTFKRVPKYTKLILLREPEILLSNFKSTTRNEIRRAKRDGVLFEIENDINFFINFFNNFANSIGLPKLTSNKIKPYLKYLVITKAIYENRVLAMHSYLVDKDDKIVRLLHSVSLRNDVEDKKERAMIGRANRFLHFEDMKFFYSKGFLIYDMGGYAFNTENKHLENINKFKDSFGGELVETSNYIPYPLYLAGKLKGLFK